MKALLLLGFSALVSTSAFAGGDPTSLKVRVYGVWASTSDLCTNPVQVFLNGSGAYVDFLTGPSLGGGDLPDGTYPCVIIKMSDTIKHTPQTTSGNCTAGTEYTGDVCQASQTANDLTGAAITCTSGGDDTVYMFMTTGSTAVSGNGAFARPVTAGDTNGIKLAAPLTISSSTRAKFVVNATGKVESAGGTCGINAPTFSFVNL